MRIAGIGCRTGVGVADVLAAIDAALDRHALGRDALAGVATIPQKASEPALTGAAELLRLPLLIATADDLRRVDGKVVTRSGASLAAAGLGSASEAAALAVAGKEARLLGPRIAVGAVTCAIATTDAVR
ncbi:MAG: cobalamin biosynthesis protein [Dongiaceae bacterium]